MLRAVGGVAGAVALAGCGSVDRYEFSARPVEIPPSRRRDLGYAQTGSETVVVERTRTVGGVEVTATVESHVAAYEPASGPAGTPDAPTIGTASTPPATVMGRSFNPLARLSLGNLLTSERGLRFLERAGIDAVGHDRRTVRWERGPTFVGRREGTCLGVETTIESYAGVLGGTPRSVAFVHVTRVHADDVVLAAAVHGHDVEDAQGEYVAAGGESAFLSRARFDDAAETFVGATATVSYASDER